MAIKWCHASGSVVAVSECKSQCQALLQACHTFPYNDNDLINYLYHRLVQDLVGFAEPCHWRSVLVKHHAQYQKRWKARACRG